MRALRDIRQLQKGFSLRETALKVRGKKILDELNKLDSRLSLGDEKLKKEVKKAEQIRKGELACISLAKEAIEHLEETKDRLDVLAFLTKSLGSIKKRIYQPNLSPRQYHGYYIRALQISRDQTPEEIGRITASINKYFKKIKNVLTLERYLKRKTHVLRRVIQKLLNKEIKDIQKALEEGQRIASDLHYRLLPNVAAPSPELRRKSERWAKPPGWVKSV